MLGFGEAFKTVCRKAFDFKGRARRSEYWWGYLAFCLIAMAWVVVAVIIASVWMIHLDLDMADDSMIFSALMPRLMLLYSPLLLLMFPLYSAITRRLHDTGHSGWWIVGQMVLTLIYFAFMAVMFMGLDGSFDAMSPELYSPGAMIAMSICYVASMVVGIVILVFTLLDSKPEENKYGPSPKYVNG